MFEIVFVVFTVASVFALVGWWKGPEIPRS
jgi:hypothetical protein